ncbi:hypothetical protein FHR85_002889 [Alkalibacillus almallahensis]|nr:hypothetical protein [Alkalibacillus almallahensis]
MTIVLLLVVWFIFQNKIIRLQSAPTASGAVVMGIGVFLYGILLFFDVSLWLRHLFVVTLILIWLLTSLAITKPVIHKQFIQIHLSDPINSFAIGTWIAGTSIVCNVIVLWLPDWEVVVIPLALLNTVMWGGYVGLVVRQFIRIWREKYLYKVHGILFLSTVSTQSIVMMYTHLIPDIWPIILSQILIIIGLVFYMISFLMMIYKYARPQQLNIADHWSNTNCIIHGAMSISGVAIFISGAFPSYVVVMMWTWALLWFIIVEVIELIRIHERYKQYGLVKGLGQYHVSQWARNFTFGMLYVLTSLVEVDGLLANIQSILIQTLPWLLVLLLVIETSLLFNHSVKTTDYHPVA